MRFFDYFRRGADASAAAEHSQPGERVRFVDTRAQGQAFSGLNDPALLEYMREGVSGGDYGRRLEQLRNMTALRCVSLICGSMGRLPLNLIANDSTKAMQTSHPAYRLLKRKPNPWQTPFEFKSQLQMHLLHRGHGYARIIGSRRRPTALIPMDPDAVQATLGSDWTMQYQYTSPGGGVIDLSQDEVFHIRDLSYDGVGAIARMRLAASALGLAKDAEEAASRTFRTGVMAGGAIESPNDLSDKAYGRMKESLDTEYSGPENANKWMLLEEGAKANPFPTTAATAQHIENRNAQIEEVGRGFGVPRPLLNMDDTSWGSGIEQLGIFFTDYTLAPWMTAWEEACARSFLSDAETESLVFKFNQHALLRGRLSDQADFFAKALGAGGQQPFMFANEVRDRLDLPGVDTPEANELRNPMTQKPRNPDEPSATA